MDGILNHIRRVSSRFEIEHAANVRQHASNQLHGSEGVRCVLKKQ